VKKFHEKSMKNLNDIKNIEQQLKHDKTFKNQVVITGSMKISNSTIIVILREILIEIL